MGSTRIKQVSSIKEAYQECTCENDIECLSIILGESEDLNLSSASLLAGGSLAKTSHKTSATTL